MKFIDSLKEKIKLDSEKTSKHFALLMNVLFSIVLLLKILNYLPSYWDTTYLFYFIVLVNSIWLMFKIKNIPEEKRDKNPMIYIFQYLFLLTLIVFVINQFVKNQVVEEWTPYLTAVSIGLGFLTFYAHRNKVENEIEEEKNKEDAKEKKREEEFSTKYPTINKIPVLRSLIKWMYKEGWGFSIPFVIIVAIFITIKIGMPLVYTGGYIDEYRHIFAGEYFIENGAFPIMYTDNLPYDRGAYFSIFVGVLLKVFGRSIFIAKMAPAIIGILSFFLVYSISKKIINSKKIILLLLVIYSFSPWIIFNNFFIRLYASYELIFLLIIFLFLKFIESMKNKSSGKSICILIVIILVNLSVYLWSYDAGRNISLIVSGIFIISMFVSGADNTFNNQNIFTRILKIKREYKFIIIGLLFLVAFFGLEIPRKIEFLFNVSLEFTSALNFKYDTFFFRENQIFSILFIISSLIGTFFLKNKSIKIVSMISITLFTIHLMSNLDLQMVRAVLYLMPLFYLISISAMNNIRKKIDKKITILFTLILLISLINSYPQDFLKRPGLPTEMEYYDYSEAYSFLTKSCKGYEVYVLISNPYIGLFYNTDIDYTSYINLDLLKKDNRYILEEDGDWIYYFGEIPTITNEAQLNSMITDYTKKICILLPERWGDADSAKFISRDRFNFLDENMEKEEFIGLRVYHS